MDLKKTDLGARAFGTDSKAPVTVKYLSQQRALDFIRGILDRGNAIGVIEGPEGSGKSTVLRQFASGLPCQAGNRDAAVGSKFQCALQGRADRGWPKFIQVPHVLAAGQRDPGVYKVRVQ